MTNPNNAVGTNAAYGGRTSVNAFNDVLGVFGSRGILSGWACVPSSGMTVALGGDNEVRDVALAMDAIGNKTTINNISEAPVEVTLAAAPSTNSRIDSIVAYVAKPPEGSDTAVDNPAAAGLITVSGSVSGSPSAPSESAIRTAITADGASGTTAYYVVLANITVVASTTVVTADMISAGPSAVVKSGNIDFATLPYASDTETAIGVDDDSNIVYQRTFSWAAPTSVGAQTIGTLPASYQVRRIYGTLFNTAVPITVPLPGLLSVDNFFRLTVNPSTNEVQMGLSNGQYFGNPVKITVEYTRS